MTPPARFIPVLLLLVFNINVSGQLDWNCDSIKNKKVKTEPKTAASVPDSSIKKNPLIHIEGNNYGNIYINNPDSSKTVPKDTFCFRNRCFENSKFEFAGYLFTDFVGIDNDKPNGLIQTNAYLSYTRPVTLCLCRQNKSKVVTKSNKFLRVYPMRNVVLIDVTLSKIGNQARYLPVRYLSGDSTKRLFNRFDLLQYSNVIALTKINLVTLEYIERIMFYFDFIPMFYNTLISDSLGTLESNVCNIAFGGNIKAKAEISNYFNAEIAWTIFSPNIFSNNYSDRAALQYKENKGPLIAESEMLHSGGHTIQAINILIGYEPKKDSKVFFRFSIYQNLFDRKEVPKNVFVQILLGTSINFDNFVKPKT